MWKKLYDHSISKPALNIGDTYVFEFAEKKLYFCRPNNCIGLVHAFR